MILKLELLPYRSCSEGKQVLQMTTDIALQLTTNCLSKLASACKRLDDWPSLSELLDILHWVFSCTYSVLLPSYRCFPYLLVSHPYTGICRAHILGPVPLVSTFAADLSSAIYAQATATSLHHVYAYICISSDMHASMSAHPGQSETLERESTQRNQDLCTYPKQPMNKIRSSETASTSVLTATC